MIDFFYHSPLAGNFPPGSSLGFHENGQLRVGLLPEARTVNAMSIKGTFSLHPNGKVSTAVLAAPFNIGTESFNPGTFLEFRDDGSLSLASFTQAQMKGPDGEPWSDRVELFFDETGKMRSSRVEHLRPSLPPHRR
jgi:hypothetical protein